MLGCTEIYVETVSGQKFIFLQGSGKTYVVILSESKEMYTLVSSGPIAVGYELRGRCYIKKWGRKYEYTLQSDKVANITVWLRSGFEIQK